MDRGGKGPSRQGEWGHIVDIRYLIYLKQASGEGEERGLKQLGLILLHLFTLRVHIERREGHISND